MHNATKHFQVAEGIARLLDSQFKIFGMRFGLDPIIGLIPGFGDVVSLLLSLYILWIGIQMRIPTHVLSQMIVNVLLDFLLGLIPFIGDVSDFFYKANTKNMTLLKEFHSAPVIEGRVI